MITVVTEYVVHPLKPGELPFAGQYLVETVGEDGKPVRTIVRHDQFGNRYVWAANAYARSLRKMGLKVDVHPGLVAQPAGSRVIAEDEEIAA